MILCFLNDHFEYIIRNIRVRRWIVCIGVRNSKILQKNIKFNAAFIDLITECLLFISSNDIKRD